MKFNIETIKEYLTQNENEWCVDEDWWGDADYVEDTLISINVYLIEKLGDENNSIDDYGVTIYELRDDDKGNWEDETDERIVGQLYFKHIKSHLGDRVFRITDVIDYEHHVYNNMDAKNPIKLK